MTQPYCGLKATLGQLEIDISSKPYAILANIYFTGDYARVSINVDRAYTINPNNLDVQRLKANLAAID